MRLTTQTDSIQITTSSIIAIDVSTDWTDRIGGRDIPDRLLSAIGSITPGITIIPGPAIYPTVRLVEAISAKNIGVSPNVVGITRSDGVTAVLLFKANLNPGDSIQYNGSAFSVIDNSGNIKGVGGTGPGVPAGGTAGQVLQKVNATDFSTSWTSDIGLSGGIKSSGILGIGYSAGAGGVVTQPTSKTTATPAINKICGDVTMNAAALASGAIVTFTLTNTLIEAGDQLIAQHQAGGTTLGYDVLGRAGAGSGTISVKNISPGSLAEAIVIRFTVFKGVTA